MGQAHGVLVGIDESGGSAVRRGSGAYNISPWAWGSAAGEHFREDTALAQSNQELERRVAELAGQLVEAEAAIAAEAAARRRSEQRHLHLAAIVDSSDDAIISKTLEGIITSWNPGAERLFGYSAQESIGNAMLMIFPPERVQEEHEILARLRRGLSVDHFETVRRTKSGALIDVSVSLSPVRDGQGRLIGASKIARDITSRKRADAKLQAQLARLDLLNQITRAVGERQDLQSIFQVVIRSLEDHLPVDFCCICLYDPPAHSLRVVRVGLKSESTAMDVAMGERSVIRIDENGLSRCVRGQLVYEPDISVVRFAFPQRLASGGLRALVAAPLLVENRVFGVLIAARREPGSFVSGECEFLRQLSEHVALAAHQSQLYGALQQAYDDLRQTQQAVMQQERLRVLGQMASGIAHDINNAISPVALCADSLLRSEQNLSERGRRHLETIGRAVEDVAHTVSRMREFYRLREPAMRLAPVDMNRLAEEVVDLTRAKWSDMPQRHGVVVAMNRELAPGLPVVMGVESEIREALINLVMNGVDAMPSGGTLTVRTRLVVEPAVGAQVSEVRRVDIEVTDTGVGMDEETRRRCLEPFFSTKGERGTGLGLAMVYGIVKRHSAELEIVSQVGTGTTVRLSFMAPDPMIADAPGPRRPTAVPSRLRILLVDDDPLVTKALRDALDMDGHVVVATHGGQEGIDVFRASTKGKEPIAVVITDLGMPHVDGRRVASEIKAVSPRTPVILLTGWGQRLVSEGDVPPHVDRVLNKPPKMYELRAALAELTTGRDIPWNDLGPARG